MGTDDNDLGTVTLTLEDDTDVECMILAIFKAGSRSYIALLPLAEDGEPESDAGVYLYRYIENGDDEDPGLENIETDEEYELASAAFNKLADEEEDTEN